jgi:uncharacterized protein (DUF697 family)/tellurite resistance protein
MTDQEKRSTLAVCLMAAFVDGASEKERAELKQIADALSGEGGPSLAPVYQDVLLGRVSLEDAATGLGSPEVKRYAYEMAVVVCDADGASTSGEKAFLEKLRGALGLPEEAKAFVAEADALATVPLEPGPAGQRFAGIGGAAAGAAGAAALAGGAPIRPDQAALDGSILKYAILNGALELLPQSLASMAIIPLQMKMVYAIGKAHGYELDRGHVKDFLATAGVGLTSQYVEEFGRKIVGGLLGKLGGGMLRGLGGAATGSAFSFATTYALGHVAKRYYGGGRRIDGDGLRQAFQGMLGEAKALQGRYAGEIQERARTLDVGQILRTVKEQ